ncbi:MAG: TonB family protein [Acidobacteria bacterium]|nr:TonB family protein [Acidobacteriota bacterium]MCA1612313.1 TonB family protein [Acidobacteriota bacterium]
MLGAAALLLALAALIVVARPRRQHATSAADSAPGTVTVDGADLRREPSAGSPVVGVLPSRTRITILSDRGPWIQARTSGGVTGYLSSENVERDADREARERRATKILTFSPVFGVVAEDATVRLAPFPFGPRAGRLKRGAAISIYAVDNAYYAFRSPDAGLAFVESSSVDLVPPDPKSPPIAPVASREIKNVTINNVSAAVATRPDSPEEEVPSGPEAPETSDEPLQPPELLSKVNPVYPEVARRAGVDGTVVLDVQISERGRVEDVQVLRGLPLGLSESAAEAVRHWQYRPARGRSGPVAAHKTVRIVFTLGR